MGPEAFVAGLRGAMAGKCRTDARLSFTLYGVSLATNGKRGRTMWARWMPNRRILELHALRRITGNEWQERAHHVGSMDAEQTHA